MSSPGVQGGGYPMSSPEVVLPAGSFTMEWLLYLLEGQLLLGGASLATLNLV